MNRRSFLGGVLEIVPQIQREMQGARETLKPQDDNWTTAAARPGSGGQVRTTRNGPAETDRQHEGRVAHALRVFPMNSGGHSIETREVNLDPNLTNS